MIRIKLLLMGSLRHKAPPDGFLELPEFSRLQDLLQHLEISNNKVQTITVNGRFEHDYRQPLADHDAVAILPITIGHSGTVNTEC